MTRRSRVAAVVLTLLLAACSDAPVAPQTKPSYDAAAQGSAMSRLAKYKAGTPRLAVLYTEQVIGPKGGSVALGGFQVDVPPGAVTSATTFSIRLPDNPGNGNAYVWASFGPHGLQFNRPVTLTVPYFGTTSEGSPSAHVMWFDSMQWIELPTTPTADGRLQTLTHHFSDYGTETPDSLGAKGPTTIGN